MARVGRGLGALVVLLGLLAGVPVLLLRLGAALPGGAWQGGLVDALLRPDDGSVLLWLVAALGWVAWACFAASVLAEVVAVVSRQRVRIGLPGLAAPRRLAAGLIAAVLAFGVTPALPHPPVPAPTAAADTRAEAAAAPPAAPARAPAPAAAPGVRAVGASALPSSPAPDDRLPGTIHVVRPGDDLWSLAEQYYGEGREWRRIAAANPDLLTGGPDRLSVGWRLRVPDDVLPEADEESVRVAAGETLSEISARELGTAKRWPEIYRANRAQLSDPDELTTGMRLALPQEQAGSDRPARPAAPAPQDRKPASSAEKPDPPEAKAGLPEPVPAERSQRPGAGPVVSPPPTAPERGGGASTGPGDARPPTGPTPAEDAASSSDGSGVPALPLVGVGGLLAAGLLAGLRRRRQLQLQSRPVGRRIVHPDRSTRPVEVALGRRQRPLSLHTLDRALRMIGVDCRERGVPLPTLQLVVVGEDRITLWLDAEAPPPPPFQAADRCWWLEAADAPYLASVRGLDEALRPWPALVTLGRDERDRPVLAELENLGLLQLVSQEPPAGLALLAALAVELSFSPWAEEMTLTLVGAADRLPAALGHHNVRAANDVDQLLDRLEQRAAVRREHQAEGGPGRHRLDPDLADAWAPEVVLVGSDLTEDQRRRLHDLVRRPPPVAIAAVVLGGPIESPWVFDLGSGGGAGRLAPVDMVLAPQRLERQESASVLELVEATNQTDTTPAPWWQSDVDEPDPPPDNVTYLGRRFGGWAPETTEGEEMAVELTRPGRSMTVEHPTLLLLGPVELVGAAGTPPPRASKQCLEYCAWLLEHPGRSAQAMTAALAVAEGTRRSNVSRLRSWLGEGPDGQGYLPDAYTGRILLHPAVSSDWERLRILTATGVNRSGTDALRAALALVRGAPLADAAPGQWHWAEELRTDMISCLRDVGVELAQRALVEQDVDLARWAAARALVAAPGDELLLAARIRTEHQAGNVADTERLSLQLAAQARRLGVDLEPETVLLLQEVVEGRVRARLA